MKRIINKGKFIESLSEERFHAGVIKFNIPNPKYIYDKSGEGVWGWVTQEEKEKYHDDNYFGTITAILVNDPIYYAGKLHWGDEVKLRCNGNVRPTLDVEWVKEYLLKG